MKTRCSVVLVIFFHLFYIAAAQPSQAEIAKMMKMAQEKVDSLKKTHPELAGYKVPDANAAIQQATTSKNKGMAQLQQIQQVQHQQINQFLPTQKNGNNAANIATPAEQAVIALAKASLQIINTKLDPITRSQLDKAASDTTVDAAGTGILLMVNGVPKWTGEYLICKAVIRNPKDEWAVNDLGAVYRNDKQYKNAIQCFLYAKQLDPASIVFATNLGWASAYYGDFNTAQQYFNDVLAVNPNFGSALEGLALIAYQKGDIAALFQCLAKEVTGFGGGGAGPSSGFVSVCGDAQMQQQMDNMGKQKNSDPNDDHTYDNNGDDNDSQQDPPATADAEPVTYPSFEPVFIKDANDIAVQAPKCIAFIKRANDEQAKAGPILAQKLSGLPPLAPASYIDEYGDKITPYSYEKFFNLYHNVHLLFEDRITDLMKELDDKLADYIKPLGRKDADLVNNYIKALGACQGDKECERQVMCDWYPRLHTAKDNDLEGLVRIWNKYFDQIINMTVWYSNASTPFIKRVHQQGWNEYMNLQREWDVRKAILSAYSRWAGSVPALQGGIAGVLQGDQLNCTVKLAGVDGADPFSKKHGKLKTFAGPCYTEPTDIDAIFIEYENNCDQTKVTVKAGPLKGYISKNYSKKFKEDDYWQTGVSLGIEKGVSHSEKAGDWNASIGGKVGAQVEVFAKYDSDLNLMERGVDVDLSATASGGVETGNAAVDQVNPIHFKEGVDVHIAVVAGQDGSTRTSITASKQ